MLLPHMTFLSGSILDPELGLEAHRDCPGVGRRREGHLPLIFITIYLVIVMFIIIFLAPSTTDAHRLQVVAGHAHAELDR